jgi:hypothetical protein
MRYEFRKCRKYRDWKKLFVQFLDEICPFLMLKQLKKCKIWGHKSKNLRISNMQDRALQSDFSLINWSKTNIKSSLPIWSTSSIQEVKKFDCWTPSIRIRVSWTDSHRWKGQFFYGISQCLEYCNNGAVIPC